MGESIKKKESFSSKVGFILAAAGSAVGLGNIWRFPYLAAKYGGGVFLIIYIILAITFGFSLMLTELAIGRRTGKTLVGAYKSINKKFSFLGVLAAIVPILITPYYCVIGGWVIKYFVTFISGKGIEAASGSDFYTNFISGISSPTIYFVIFVVFTSVAVLLGVQKGIEIVSKIMMPMLILLIFGIAIYICIQPGAGEGIKYYLLPDFTDFTPKRFFDIFVAAAGQLFYSMSIAMGILITYGCYMRKEDNLETSVRQIEIFDTGVALLAGIIIVPAVFIFSGGDKNALNAGPSLMFITLPKVFESMPGGDVIGTVFFLLVILAALTSSISLLETVVSIIAEKFSLKRLSSTLIAISIVFVLGMVSVLGYSVLAEPTKHFIDLVDSVLGFKGTFNLESPLDIFDFITNNVLMPIVAFATCILIGYVAKPAFVEEEVLKSSTKFKMKGIYRIMIKVICPICMALILFGPFILK